jgi:hypothetical protein
MEFIPDAEEIVKRALAHIDKKRAALGLVEYDPKRYGQSGDSVMLKILAKQDEEVLNVNSSKVA